MNILRNIAANAQKPTITISGQPAAFTTTEDGTTASYSVTASASLGATPAYQWQVSTDSGSTYNNIAGQTSSSLSLSGLTAASNGYLYRCAVTAGANQTKSNGAILNTAISANTMVSNWSSITGGGVIASSTAASVWSAEKSLFVVGRQTPTGTSTTPFYRSSDGGSWSANTAITGIQTGVGSGQIEYAPSLGIFVAGNSSSTSFYSATSSDGINWTVAASAAPQRLLRIVWSPGASIFVSTAGGSAASANVLSSTDGVTWTSRSTGTSAGYQAVVWNPTAGEFLVLAATSNRYAKSSNGTSWSGGTTNIGPVTAVTWSASLGIYVAVSNAGTAAKRAFTSSDGITWTSRDTPQNAGVDPAWAQVRWAPELGLFVAVATSQNPNNIMTSPDGATWTMRTMSGSYPLADVQWSSSLKRLILCGTSGNNITTYKYPY
jgi:hypothetical protein